MVEVGHKAIQGTVKVICMPQIKIQIEFFLDPTIERFYDRIVRRSR